MANNKIYAKRFDSVCSFENWLTSTPATWPASQCASIKGDKKFTLTKNMDEANNLLRFGWNEGAKEIRNIMDLSAAASSSSSYYKLSPVGFLPMVGPALSGSPRNMLRKVVTRQPARVVTIAYNMAVGSCIPAKWIKETAAKLFNVINSFERSGIRVELWAVDLTSDYYQRDDTVLAVRVKTASQPFNLLSMCYPIVHPSMLRRHQFAFIERLGVKKSNWHGYGTIITEKEKSRELLKTVRIDTENIFSYYDLSGKTETEIAKMIK